MKTVALVGFSKVAYMPYLQFYLEQMDFLCLNIHLVYWQRDREADAPVPEGVAGHAFCLEMDDSQPPRSRIGSLLKYRAHVLRSLRKIRPDLLVILYSTTGVLLADRLLGRYRKRYILDYRDVSYEHLPLYRRLIAALVKGSVLTCISSDAFRKYLPDHPGILTVHNLSASDSTARVRVDKAGRGDEEPIRVRIWGLLRHPETNRQLIERLGGDPRFELHFHGLAQGEMLVLLRESSARFQNVFFHGTYLNHERTGFAAATDLLHNLFDNDRIMAEAMSNKYYDGLLFGVPQLCRAGSFMGVQVTRAGVGLACDPTSETFADEVHAYCKSLDRSAFLAACDAELKRILTQMEDGRGRLKGALFRAGCGGKEPPSGRPDS